MSRLFSSKATRLLLCTLLLFCVVQFSYADELVVYQCTTTESETPVACSTLFALKCPSTEEISLADPICDAPQGSVCSDDKPTECITFNYLCKTSGDDAEFTFQTCIPSMTQFTLQDPLASTYTFDRDVQCQATNYLGQLVKVDDGCSGTKPVAQVVYDPANAATEATSALTQIQCTPFSTSPSTSPESCPAVTDFKTNFVAQNLFCSGKTTTVDQVCSYELSVTATGYKYTTAPVTCPTTDALALECPVYKITCVDYYAVPAPEEEDSVVPPPFSLTADGDEAASEDGAEEEASVQEINAAECKIAFPTCPTCTQTGIPLITDFSIKAGFNVKCYSRVPKAVNPPNGGGDGEFIALADPIDPEQFDWELVINPSDDRYTLCLRASDFTAETDPKKTQPATTCDDIVACPHFKCQDKALNWSFEACYDNDADSSGAECVLKSKFPVCAGTRTLISKCFQGNTEWTATPPEYSVQADETNPCTAQELYPHPTLTQDCRPDTQCPTFSWSTDVIISDEKDSDHSEEETSSDAVITTNGRKLTAKLINVDLSAEKPWKLTVYQRVVEQDAKTLKLIYNYTPIEDLVQEKLTSDTVTVDVAFATLPLDSYFVLRAEYDAYTLIEEESSYDAATGEPIDIDNLAKFTLAQTQPPGEETEEDSFENGKQKPGFEKLGKIVNQCRILFHDKCENRSQCIESVNTDTQESTFSCSCVQAFSGNTCSECTLAQADCANGSTLYVEPDSTEEPSHGDGQDEETSNFMVQVAAIEKDKEIKKEKQCKCVCLKANSGGKCDCKAMYIRFDFKSELITASTSQNPGITAAQQQIAINQWLATFVAEFTSDIKLSYALFDTFHSDLAVPAVSPAPIIPQQETVRRNHVILRVAACKANPAQQQMLLSALQQRIMLAQTTTTQLSSDEVNTTWKEYTASARTLPSTAQVGGVSAFAAAYDPNCTGSECAPDVTTENYDPSQGVAPVDDSTDGNNDDSGLSGIAIFFIVIGVIIAVGAIIVIIVYCCCNGSANKRKQFGSGNGANDHHGGSELDLT